MIADIDLKNIKVYNYLGIQFITTVNMSETTKLNPLMHNVPKYSDTL